MAVNQIQSLSNKHEAILQHMLANPAQKLSEVAAAFQVSQPWLSVIIHSDAFQRQLRERQDAVFHHTVLPLRDKMQAIAHKAMDKILEAPAEAMDLDTAHNLAESMLDRLGFSPKQPLQHVDPAAQIAAAASKDLLERARGLIGVQSKVTVSLEVTNDAPVVSEQAHGHSVGSIQRHGALPAIEGEYTESKARAGV